MWTSTESLYSGGYSCLSRGNQELISQSVSRLSWNLTIMHSNFSAVSSRFSYSRHMYSRKKDWCRRYINLEELMNMFPFEFNLFSTMYKIQLLFTAHWSVLLCEGRSGRYLVHQILEPYAVVTATAEVIQIMSLRAEGMNEKTRIVYC
jgi:hypothetical protein